MKTPAKTKTLTLCWLLIFGFAGCGKSKPEPVSRPAVTQDSEPESAPATPAVASSPDSNLDRSENGSAIADASEPDLPTGSAEAAQGQLGTLKLRFKYAGEANDPEAIKVGGNVAFCGQFPLVDERLLIHPENKGIKNVVVYVYTGRGGPKLPGTPRESVVTLANQNCRFEPRIVLAQVGDTLKVTNPDAVGHNANLAFFNNKAENLLIPPGQHALVDLPHEEPAPIPVDCNIHPWMKSFIVVLPHPFAAVSDDNGDLAIEGLPVGEPLVFRAFHEAGAITSVTIDGNETEWKRSRFEVELHPGVNDMGTVILPAGAF